jgi:hypothetical protein
VSNLVALSPIKKETDMRTIGVNYNHVYHLKPETRLLVIEGDQPSIEDDETDGDKELPNPLYWDEIEDSDRQKIEDDLTQFGVTYMLFNDKPITLRILD